MRNFALIVLTSVILLTFIGCSAGATEKPASTPVTPVTLTPKPNTTSPNPTATTPSSSAVNRVDLVYFHPKRRCALCLNIEVRTKAFLEQYFKDQMAAGKITFTSYELEDKNNAAIIKKYGAISSQLFINTIVNGKENIQHVEKIWSPQIYNDAQAFDQFMSDLIRNCLSQIS